MLDPKIYTLLKLEELGSYTRAAEALSLTQPAVSHHIKLLEEEYGVQIFVKGSRELKPTAAGALLLKYAHRAAAISEKARQALKDSVNQIERLSIGITPTASDLLAPQVIAAYLNAHPNMRVEVVRGPIKKIDAMLRFYELDFAIVDGVMPGGRYSSILLGTDYLCLIASPDHPFAKRSSVTLDELTNEKLVLRPKAAGTRKLFEGYLISHGRSIQDYRVIMEIDSVSAIKEIVAGNLGVSIISHNVCHEEEKSGKLAVVPIENCRMVRQLSLVFPPDFQHPELLRELQAEYSRRIG
ncbi:MAG TPA: LysR family transcriptional regulator [Candidatus Faecivicinus avistercoris]|nr:LysR family transcriptional regulator [Candidatus Faecivicinus avistercoris]